YCFVFLVDSRILYGHLKTCKRHHFGTQRGVQISQSCFLHDYCFVEFRANLIKKNRKRRKNSLGFRVVSNTRLLVHICVSVFVFSLFFHVFVSSSITPSDDQSVVHHHFRDIPRIPVFVHKTPINQLTFYTDFLPFAEVFFSKKCAL